MAVNVEVNQLNKNELPFPKLMKTKRGSIVYFTEPKCGFALTYASGEPHWHQGWVMDDFEDLTESITLSNE